MKRLKKMTALMLTLCLVLTGAVPAYAEEMTVPEKNAEASEVFAETAETIVPEAVCAEAAEAIAAEAVEAEPAEDEAAGDGAADFAEKTDPALWTLGADGDQPKITYYDYVGGKMVEMIIPNDTVKSYVPVTSAVTSFEAGTWYVINGNVEIGSRIENNAAKDTPAHLILADGAVLTVRGGIRNER